MVSNTIADPFQQSQGQAVEDTEGEDAANWTIRSEFPGQV
jgi:predicted XRE-type DNA-binding protein